MAEPQAAETVANDVLEGHGITPFSIMGGVRASRLMAEAVRLDRQRRADSPGESRTVNFREGDWAFDIDDDSCSDEAWWVDLQLFSPDDESWSDRNVVGLLSLSDVELEGLITAATDILNEGRARFS